MTPSRQVSCVFVYRRRACAAVQSPQCSTPASRTHCWRIDRSTHTSPPPAAESCARTSVRLEEMVALLDKMALERLKASGHFNTAFSFLLTRFLLPCLPRALLLRTLVYTAAHPTYRFPPPNDELPSHPQDGNEDGAREALKEKASTREILERTNARAQACRGYARSIVWGL
jgi:hypothetical protein